MEIIESDASSKGTVNHRLDAQALVLEEDSLPSPDKLEVE